VVAFRRLVVVIAVLATACSGVDDDLSGRFDELRSSASDVADRSQFCFAVTRALTSVDGGSTPEQARAAAEEVLAQAPDEIRDDANLVADRLEQAAREDDTSVLDEEFRAAAERLRDDTRALCDPTD
jgi:hypothetical protein